MDEYNPYFDNVVEKFFEDNKPKPKARNIDGIRLKDMTATERELHAEKVAARKHLKLVHNGR